MKTGVMVVLLVVISAATGAFLHGKFGTKEQTVVTTVKYLPDSLALWGQTLTVDSLQGALFRKGELWERERHLRAAESQRVRDLAALVNALRDTSSGDSIPNLLAEIDTALTLTAENDSSSATALVAIGVTYDIGSDLFRDIRAGILDLQVHYLRPVTTIETTKYESYIAWAWVLPIAAVLAALLHITLK